MAPPRKSLQPPHHIARLSTQEAFTTFECSAALQQRLGLPVEVLTPEQVRNRWPWLSVSDIVGATYCPTDGYGSPHEVMQAFATQARRLGASFVEGADVSAITRQGAWIMTVETNRGSFSPGIVIICAGAWSGELGRLAGVEIPVQPLRRMCFVTDPFDAIPHDVPMTIEMPNTFHFRPEGADFMLGTSDQDEPYGFNTTMNWHWLSRVVEDAVKRVPVLEQARIHHGWAGLYETSPDHNAILGPIPIGVNLRGAGVSLPGFGVSPSSFFLPSLPAAASNKRKRGFSGTPRTPPRGCCPLEPCSRFVKLTLMGPIPGVENMLVATGFSGHGVMQSPATGMIMSEFILDGKAHTIDVSDLGIERFSTGRLNPEKHVI